LFLLEKVKNHHKSLPSSVLIKKLITSSKNINCMLEPNNPIKFFKRGHDCLFIGVQLAWTQLIVVEHFPREPLKREGYPHHIHIDRGNNFKITPSSAWVYLLICLAGSGIWATYSSDWWWAINSTSIAYMLLGMLFLGVWGNLHLSLKSLIWMGKGLMWDLLSWVSLVRGKDKDSYRRIFFSFPH
jgi:hypothetical protein